MIKNLMKKMNSKNWKWDSEKKFFRTEVINYDVFYVLFMNHNAKFID